MMEDQFKSAYQEWFDRQNESVPEEVWDNIQDQLDIDSAWDTISDRLDHIPATPMSTTGGGWWSALVVGWVATLLITVSFPLNQELPYPSELLAEQSEIDEVDNKLPTIDPANTTKIQPLAPAVISEPLGTIQSPDRDAIVTLEEQPYTEAVTSNRAGQPSDFVNSEIAIAEQAEAHESTSSVPPIQEKPSHMADNASPVVHAVSPVVDEELAQLSMLPRFSWNPQRQAIIHSLPEVHIPDEPAFFALTQVGAIGGIKNSWLLNPETRYGLEANSLIDTRTTWAIDAGIRIQGVIKGKHGVGADVLFVSPTRQDYKQYVNARYVDRSIALTYQRLHLYYLQPVSRGTQLMLGGYVARLNRAVENVGDDNYARTDQFKPIDYGLLVGFQQQYPIWKRWSFQVGAQAILGLPNIYQGTATIPASLNVTREASFSVIGGFVYQFKK